MVPGKIKTGLLYVSGKRQRISQSFRRKIVYLFDTTVNIIDSMLIEVVIKKTFLDINYNIK